LKSIEIHGIAEFAGLEIAGLEIAGLEMTDEVEVVANDGLEFGELRNKGLKIFPVSQVSVTRY